MIKGVSPPVPPRSRSRSRSPRTTVTTARSNGVSRSRSRSRSPARFFCSICQVGFDFQSRLDRHLQSARHKKQVDRKKEFARSRKKCMEREASLPTVSSSSSSSVSLKKNSEVISVGSTASVPTTSLRLAPVQCISCKRYFKNYARHARHIANEECVNPATTYTCTTCHLTLDNAVEWVEHNRKNHPDPNTKWCEQLCSCEGCQMKKAQSSYHQLRTHAKKCAMADHYDYTAMSPLLQTLVGIRIDSLFPPLPPPNPTFSASSSSSSSSASSLPLPSSSSSAMKKAAQTISSSSSSAASSSYSSSSAAAVSKTSGTTSSFVKSSLLTSSKYKGEIWSYSPVVHEQFRPPFYEPRTDPPADQSEPETDELNMRFYAYRMFRVNNGPLSRILVTERLQKILEWDIQHENAKIGPLFYYPAARPLRLLFVLLWSHQDYMRQSPVLASGSGMDCSTFAKAVESCHGVVLWNHPPLRTLFDRVTQPFYYGGFDTKPYVQETRHILSWGDVQPECRKTYDPQYYELPEILCPPPNSDYYADELANLFLQDNKLWEAAKKHFRLPKKLPIELTDKALWMTLEVLDLRYLRNLGLLHQEYDKRKPIMNPPDTGPIIPIRTRNPDIY